MEALMVCTHCGCSDTHNLRFCINCGQPLHSDTVAPPPIVKRGPKDRRKKALAISVAAAAVLLVILILVLALSANPVAGRWYAQDGSELFFLKNGKGMTVSDTSGDAGRVHFMYAVGYREPGYIEGEIYDKAGSGSSWFYIYDGKLEWDGRYYYRHRPAAAPKGLN